jgi:uncharacterized membrane protein
MAQDSWNDQRIETVIANLLRAGVMLAAGLVLAGAAIFLVHHGGERLDRHAFHGEPPDLRSVGGVLRGVAALHGRDVIQLGLLVLIATPMARVAFAVFGFARQGDRMYAAIALLVLALLGFSLAVGHF